ncbi:MAG: LytTR family DNA-binding domain-containing protein [Rhodothermales bacterium]
MLRTLLVDDEAPARSRLARLLQPFVDAGRVRIVGEAADGVEALDLLGDEDVDLLLLDIQMPGLDGFDVLDRLPPERRPVVVFTTAHDAYALRAFEASAVDYLLKPIREDRLAAAVERAEKLTDGARRDGDDRLGELLEYLDRQAVQKPAPEPADYLKQLSIPGADRLTIVSVDQLLAAEVEEGITRLYVLNDAPSGPPGTTPGRTPQVGRHIVSHTLDALERRLDPERFMRVHRSSIVQLDHIREMIQWFSGRYKLVLTGGHEVIASRSRSKELRDRLSL